MWKPDGVSSISFRTCARILARACAILASVLVSARPRARRTVEPLSVAFEPVLLVGRQLLAGSLTWFRSVFGRPYTSGTSVTVTEEVTSPTTFGGSQDVMIAVTWTSQVSRLGKTRYSRRIRFLSAVISACARTHVTSRLSPSVMRQRLLVSSSAGARRRPMIAPHSVLVVSAANPF